MTPITNPRVTRPSRVERAPLPGPARPSVILYPSSCCVNAWPTLTRNRVQDIEALAILGNRCKERARQARGRPLRRDANLGRRLPIAHSRRNHLMRRLITVAISKLTHYYSI
jgi:hypothetical protein